MPRLGPADAYGPIRIAPAAAPHDIPGHNDPAQPEPGPTAYPRPYDLTDPGDARP